MEAVQRYFKEVVDGFVTVLVGMVVTGREFLQHKWRVATVQYPREPVVLPPRFRGMLFNDVRKCIACSVCAKECPVNCITVVATGKGRTRHPEVFIIDFNKCMWCDMCVEVCPSNSLYMTHEFETIFRDRRNLVINFMDYDQAPPRPLDEEQEPEIQWTGPKAKLTKPPVTQEQTPHV